MPQSLHTAEIVHWIALGVMALVYTMRIMWLLKYKPGKDKSVANDSHGITAKRGARYSLANVAMPWSMESTRRNMLFYISFVLFHMGVVAGIAMAFISTLSPAFVASTPVAYTFGTLMACAFLVGLGRMIRRLTVPHMKLISTPDDYFSLLMLICWFGLGTVTQMFIAGSSTFTSINYLVAYLYLTSFFLLYVPFSKISHYLYYPFTRWYLGKALGHRGSLPATRG
jgi:nitrate reductase gamma subunit